jgi:hypothetical protein
VFYVDYQGHISSQKITSTAKRAHILSFRASITPFKMVKPNPLIISAISKKKPRSSQSIYKKRKQHETNWSVLHNRSVTSLRSIKCQSLPQQAFDEVDSDPRL